MRVATWNVNSIAARLPHVTAWLAEHQPDVLCLQEIKTETARFPAAAFAELVRRYADMVYATARRVTGSGAIAEDVAQDCFLRLAQGSHSHSHRLQILRLALVAGDDLLRRIF